MAIRNSASSYGWPAQALHWSVVVLVIAQYVLANMAEAADSRMDMFVLFARHKSVGLTIFALAVVRLVWRFMNEQPRLPVTMPVWQRTLAQATHWLLYVLVFLLPITGVLGSAASNYPVTWFGAFAIPPLLEPNEALGDLLHEIHKILAGSLAVVAGIHLLGALKHHFVDKDDILRRMLWKSG